MFTEFEYGKIKRVLMITQQLNVANPSQSYGFPSSNIWMWEFDHKEIWAPKYWCFQTVVLEKTLDNPLNF